MATMSRELIQVDRVFLGHIEPFFKPLSNFRGVSKRPVFFAYRQDGQRTEFTLPSRKQAIEWLVAASQKVSA
jgi:hypothetical protein